MALLKPELLDCVVAIGNGKNEWFGTGFFYEHQINEERHIFLITNQHVIESQIEDGKNEIRLKTNSKIDGTVKTIDIKLCDENDNYAFIFHPDKDVDLAIIPVDFYEIIMEIGQMEVRFFTNEMSCNKNRMKKNGICEGDRIFVFGFPMGNVHINQKSVIVRNGSIARMQDIFYSDSKSFLIDAFIFPGNSGGPVFLVPQMESIEGTQPFRWIQLIGVVKEYLAYEDVAKSTQTGETRVIFTENSGLALVHPMDHVDELINIYKKKLPY